MKTEELIEAAGSVFLWMMQYARDHEDEESVRWFIGDQMDVEVPTQVMPAFLAGVIFMHRMMRYLDTGQPPEPLPPFETPDPNKTTWH